MKQHFFLLALVCLVLGCQSESKSHYYNAVNIKTVFEDSVSIRAIEYLDNKTLAFAGSKGIFGTVDIPTGKIRTNTMKYHTKIPAFRAVAHTSTDFFMLSIESPALLYKTAKNGQMELVYKEEGEGVFYDAMKFWNDLEGIAIGDEVNGCLSIIITKDGGQTWNKLSCSNLPKGIDGEGAFAASNTNIEIQGEIVWIITTSGRIYISEDRGETWNTMQTPIINEKETQGIYSIDFYDENLGFAVGGDFTEPDANIFNKILTTDGGKTWKTIADEQPPGYKSCVQYIPNSGGNDLVTVGFTGIDYSDNGGVSWKTLSEEGFYTIRFLNDSIAYAAGKYRIARLVFK
ncbi:WD40/YVTN/BNR-like repeat-containing protein [Croceitalea rosinachiae]|uniref:Oxidoreductase n=1 Tax=Croceitalea rosinachiae TaxID=3075596 RepID=A0ABU3AB85_9FLAO|nr:oxidoreductase [Croceitalea sp. F388]MDT0607170.1 oxidoreductase [Croceitalea sp. F388]